jgi:YD repeat-containing protein
MRNLFTKIIYSSFVLSSCNLLGQIPKSPINVQAPNATSFSTLADFKVSSFVGSPAIEIPLCKLSDGSLDINLGLNYNAMGVKPDVHPGWVGLNMNLPIGGAIVRTVKDGPDDNPNNGGTYGPKGFFYGRNLLNINNWSSNAGIRTIADYNFSVWDTEPDEFSFNMMGLSGKFYLGNDGRWKVQSEQDIKVEIIGSLTGSTTYPPFTPPSYTLGRIWDGQYLAHTAGFILTDENGTKYEFGGGNNAFMEYSMNFFEQGQDTWTCNAWYLKSIKTHTGQVINFTYERGDFVAQMFFSIYNKKYDVDGSGFITPSCSGPWSSYINIYGPYNGKLISPLYLKEVTSKNLKINFISSESTELRYNENIFAEYINGYFIVNPTGASKLDILTYLYDCFYPMDMGSNTCGSPTLTQLLTKLKWRKLDKIRVTNTYDNVIAKEFEFTYNNVATERLMLKKVQEKAYTTSETIAPYEFTYNDDASINLPNYGYTHTDHWGFNNGFTINRNTDFIPANSSTYGVNYRSPNTDKKYYLEGTLNKIKYPAGGFTEFTFEPHTYSKEVKLNRSMGVDDYLVTKGSGGLRIKNIRSYDPTTPTSVIEKTFYYVNGFNPESPSDINTLVSSGVLGGKTQYYWNDYRPQTEDNNVTYKEEVFSTQSVLPSTENGLGSHIGYSEIVEKPSSGGWVIHKFSNYDNGYLDESFEGHLQVESTPYENFNSKSFTRGKLLSKTDYFENGNPASKISYLYGALGSEHARSVRTEIKSLCGTATRVYEGTAYKIYTYKFKPIQEQVLIYHQTIPSAFVTSTTNYSYNAFGQVNEVKKSQSDGSELISRMKYVHEYDDLLEPQCYSEALTLYGDCSSCVSQAEVDAWLAQINTYVASCTNVPYDQTSQAIFKMRDKHIWSMVEELKYRKRSGTETIIGGNITLPKEFIFNSVSNLMPSLAYKLHIANPVASNTVSFSALNLSRNLIYDTKYKRPEIEFLKYNEAGNLLELIDYSNVSTSYLWGYRNRLPIAEVRNVSYTDVESTLTASIINNLKDNVVTEALIRSSINNLRTSVDRKVTTYTHDVVYGLKSSTDPSNIPSFYNYDGLGRLKTLTDKDNNILKGYSYLYAGATGGTGCTVAAPTITSTPASTGCNTVLSASTCSGTTTWSNSLTGSSITVPSVATPTYTATCTVGTCTSPASNALAGLNLPSGWNPVETGTGVNGCTVLGSNQVRMSAAPSGGIGGSTPDTYYFVDKQYTGNVTMIAKISSMSTTANIRAGLIFRNSLTPKSPFFQIVQAGDDVVGKFYRNLENGDATIWKYGTGIPAGAWLRIKKVGNNVNSYYSTLSNPNINNDGDWTEILPNVLNPDPSITWGTNFLIGMSLTNAIGSGIPSAQVIWSSVQVNNNGVLETPFN